MQIYDELVARGLIAQTTDEDEIRDLVNNGKAVFYIGFDPTADSLHVGHFMALCLMKRLQMAGNKPIALIGGGTAMIGDPSGRTDMRQMMTKETIQHNVDCFKKQMSKFIDFSEDKALLVNNADWLLDLNYVDVLRDVGACFSVNNMLRAECYKQRMEKGLSFLEFNYMIMQSYDFYALYQKYGCNMQFGGDDQWSNMLGGTPLGHIADHDRTFGALARDRHTVEAFPGFGIQAANGPEDQQKQENPFHGYSSFSMIRSGRAQLGRAAGGGQSARESARRSFRQHLGERPHEAVFRRRLRCGGYRDKSSTPYVICNGCVSNRGRGFTQKYKF